MKIKALLPIALIMGLTGFIRATEIHGLDKDCIEAISKNETVIKKLRSLEVELEIESLKNSEEDEYSFIVNINSTRGPLHEYASASERIMRQLSTVRAIEILNEHIHKICGK